ncbi:conserved hypothetical protein [Candidatus Protochlamydia naegleriophila]|uniref:Outer membrane lipoprotein BamD-like domain-containing protein n=1 Tax=Candidatus Protochlamydia naegleriophila TaxID=389348 RepID=A0A0U5ETJ8_9BACT|nr:tetratricopeptide repeat protein [Candidatus Protochlamydia naegleriophila]CUI17587.1 conserved hypothetical protein [Candidatus Protochlamydia naegleriophila]
MKKRSILPLMILSCVFGLSAPAYASKAKPFTCQDEADRYLIQHYNCGCHHYNRKEWRQASNEFEKVIHFFPDSEEAAEAYYYLGICFFEMKEYDFSNQAFSNYITASTQPSFFEDAVYYKFCIAEHFKRGKKRRPLTYRYFPKWLPGQTLALTIYDEVVVALPNHDLTVCALYSKAELLQKMENYREAIDTYQTLIRRFPKHEMTPTCYLKIAESYCQQSVYEFQNPDILALAELNARKFKEEFPRDEKVEEAEGYVSRIKEMYAKGLCDVGLFYERMSQPGAAAIYYQSSIEEFPETRVADFCRARLKCLGCDSPECDAPECESPEGDVAEGDDVQRSDSCEEQELRDEGRVEPFESHTQPMNPIEPPHREPVYSEPVSNEVSNEPEVPSEPAYDEQVYEQVSSEAFYSEPVYSPLPMPEYPDDALLNTPILIEEDIYIRKPSYEGFSEEENHFGVPYYKEPVPPANYQECDIEEDLEAPAPYFLHYSLLKKKEVERRDRKGRTCSDD